MLIDSWYLIFWAWDQCLSALLLSFKAKWYWLSVYWCCTSTREHFQGWLFPFFPFLNWLIGSLGVLLCYKVSETTGLSHTHTHYKSAAHCLMKVSRRKQAGVHRLFSLLCCFNRQRPPPIRPHFQPPSPPFHPHKSLMMCRLHRAGLSNDIITISKNLLLPYGPTSCGMLHGAGRWLPQTASSPYIFISKWQPTSARYAFLSLPAVVCCFN